MLSIQKVSTYYSGILLKAFSSKPLPAFRSKWSAAPRQRVKDSKSRRGVQEKILPDRLLAWEKNPETPVEIRNHWAGIQTSGKWDS
jgi:hypothetical protein